MATTQWMAAHRQAAADTDRIYIQELAVQLESLSGRRTTTDYVGSTAFQLNTPLSDTNVNIMVDADEDISEVVTEANTALARTHIPQSRHLA